jgi:hypothetical protein
MTETAIASDEFTAFWNDVLVALKPGGRLMFVTWRALEHNPWVGIPKAVVLKFLPPPGDDAQTCGPGPFSMANTDVVRPSSRRPDSTTSPSRRPMGR